MSRFRPPPRLLLNALLAGALLRFVDLSAYSLWLDEGATWLFATAPTWGDTLFAEANHPPAWYLFTRAWIQLFGDSAWSLRAPAAILGVLTIHLGWRLGLRLFVPSRQPARGGFAGPPGDPVDAAHADRRGVTQALWLAGLLSLSPYLCEYQQEARMYPLLLAESLGLCLLYLWWLDGGGRKVLVGYAALAALTFHTHYFAFLPIAANGAHALRLWYRGRGTAEAIDIRPFLLSNIVAGLLFVPWFLYLLSEYRGLARPEDFGPMGKMLHVLWRMGIGPGVAYVDRARQAGGLDAVMQEELPWIIATVLLWFPAIIAGAFLLVRRAGTKSFLAFSLLVPIGLLIAMYPFFPLIHERYLLFLAPIVFAIVSEVLVARRLWLQVPAILCVSTLFVLGQLAYHGAPFRAVNKGVAADGTIRYGTSESHGLAWLHHGHPYGREPWRQVHDMLEDIETEGDLVILHPHYMHYVWDHYDRPPERVPLPLLHEGPEGTAELLRPDAADAKRVFLVVAHEDRDDPLSPVRAVQGALALLWAETGDVAAMQPHIIFEAATGIRIVTFLRE